MHQTMKKTSKRVKRSMKQFSLLLKQDVTIVTLNIPVLRTLVDVLLLNKSKQVNNKPAKKERKSFHVCKQ